ncbi:MAG: apolipoprotein N-acyltransferase [bacterium]
MPLPTAILPQNRTILALGSTGLLSICSPALNWSGTSLLIWVSLVPLGIALYGATTKQGAWLGGCFGTILWISQTWGLHTTLTYQPGLPWWISIILWLFLCFIAGIPYLIFGLLITRLNWIEKPAGALRTALLWVGLTEWIPSLAPIFPVHALGQQAAWLQVVHWGGTPTLHLLLIWVNWLIVHSFLRFKNDYRRLRNHLILIAFIPVIIFSWGSYELHRSQNGPFQELQIGWVQPNFTSIPNEENPVSKNQLLSLLKQSTELIQTDPNIEAVFWPEVPFPLSWVDQVEQRQQIRQAVVKWQRPLFMVSSTVDDPKVIRGEQFAYYNVAQMIGSTGIVRASQTKQKLVPFGEYLPGEESFPFLRDWLPNARRYLAGSELNLLPLSEGSSILAAICYEIGFESILKQALESRVRVVWNPVNDGWFPSSMAAWHRALAQFSSVEIGLPLIRVSNSGYTVISDARGVVLQTGEWDQSIAKTVKIPVPEQAGPWLHIAEIAQWVLLGWILLDVGLGLLLRRSQED